MIEEVKTLNCGRESELIAFLYGELSDAESHTFQHHVGDCPACRAELTALGEVRDSVVAWRNESLGGVIAGEHISKTRLVELGVQKPSALTALRTFFNLSPLWMKGATALATLVFCVLVGLTVARWRQVPSPEGANPTAQVSSEQQINAVVERRVQDELQRMKSLKEPASTSPLVVGVTSQGNRPRRFTPAAQASRNVAATGRQPSARRPLSRVEREELAADLRLTSGNNEGDLDLLDDNLNE